jgi:hypothetical protein
MVSNAGTHRGEGESQCGGSQRIRGSPVDRKRRRRQDTFRIMYFHCIISAPVIPFKSHDVVVSQCREILVIRATSLHCIFNKKNPGLSSKSFSSDPTKSDDVPWAFSRYLKSIAFLEIRAQWISQPGALARLSTLTTT